MTPVFTSRVHGWRFWHPWTHYLSHCPHYPCSRSVFTVSF